MFCFIWLLSFFFFTFYFHSSSMMWLGVVLFILILLGLAEVYESVNLCLSSDLGNFGYSSDFLPSSFWGSDINMYVKPFDVIWKISEAVLFFPFPLFLRLDDFYWLSSDSLIQLRFALKSVQWIVYFRYYFFHFILFGFSLSWYFFLPPHSL